MVWPPVLMTLNSPEVAEVPRSITPLGIVSWPGGAGGGVVVGGSVCAGCVDGGVVAGGVIGGSRILGAADVVGVAAAVAIVVGVIVVSVVGMVVAVVVDESVEAVVVVACSVVAEASVDAVVASVVGALEATVEAGAVEGVGIAVEVAALSAGSAELSTSAMARPPPSSTIAAAIEAATNAEPVLRRRAGVGKPPGSVKPYDSVAHAMDDDVALVDRDAERVSEVGAGESLAQRVLEDQLVALVEAGGGAAHHVGQLERRDQEDVLHHVGSLVSVAEHRGRGVVERVGVAIVDVGERGPVAGQMVGDQLFVRPALSFDMILRFSSVRQPDDEREHESLHKSSQSSCSEGDLSD